MHSNTFKRFSQYRNLLELGDLDRLNRLTAHVKQSGSMAFCRPTNILTSDSGSTLAVNICYCLQRAKIWMSLFILWVEYDWWVLSNEFKENTANLIRATLSLWSLRPGSTITVTYLCSLALPIFFLFLSKRINDPSDLRDNLSFCAQCQICLSNIL